MYDYDCMYVTVYMKMNTTGCMTMQDCMYDYVCMTLTLSLTVQYFVIVIMAHRATITLRAMAGVAKPNPKLGQALGPLGINMVKFCEEFNKLTSHVRPDVPMRVMLEAFTDRTYKFIVKPPDTSYFLRKASGIEKFTPLPAHTKSGEINVQYLYEIAKIKKQVDPDLKNVGLPQIMSMVIGQLGSCGLEYAIDVEKPKLIAVKLKV